MPDRAKIIFDHPQYRMKSDLVAIAFRGEDLFSDLYEHAMVHRATGTAFCRPMCQYSDYWSINTGIYAKPTIGGGLSVVTSASWKAVDKLNSGFTTHYQCDISSGEYIRTTSAVSKNQGVFFSGFLHNAGDNPVVYEVGWSDSATPTAATASVGAKIYTDGRIEVYKGGTFVGAGNVSPAQNDQLNVLFLPFRRRDLLVLSQDGSSFVVTFDDIEESDTAPTISPAEKFFCISPSASSMTVMIDPAAYETTGYIVTKSFKLIRPPKAMQTLATWTNTRFPLVTGASIQADGSFSGTDSLASASLKQANGTSAFTADGTAYECRGRCDFSSDGIHTSFLYGMTFMYSAEFAETDGSEEFDATPYINKAAEIRLSVPDDGFGATLSATLMDPETVEETVPDLRVTNWRPVSFQFGDLGVLDGYMKRPSHNDAIVAEVKRMEFECFQIESMLEQYTFQTRVPMDGWPLCTPDGFCAVRFLLELVMPGTYLSLSDLDYILPEIPSGDGSEWNLAAEIGETGLEVMEKLHRLASDCVYGSHPGPDGPEFWFKTLDDLPQEPCVTLYRDPADAQLADPLLTTDEALDICYDGWREEPLEIEANDIQATGIDPRTNAIVAAYVVDEASQDPTLPPSSRPENWVGFPLCLGVAARSIRSIEDAERVVEKLAPLATEVKKCCEWDANTVLLYEDEATGVMLPVWRFDLVNLDGIGERRVSSLDARFIVEEDENEVADPLIVRRAHYCGGTIIGRGGMTVAQIQANNRTRLANRGVRQLTPTVGVGMVSAFYTVSKVTP